jgi:hypothetical protein
MRNLKLGTQWLKSAVRRGSLRTGNAPVEGASHGQGATWNEAEQPERLCGNMRNKLVFLFRIFPGISAYFRVFPHNGFIKKTGPIGPCEGGLVVQHYSGSNAPRSPGKKPAFRPISGYSGLFQDIFEGGGGQLKGQNSKCKNFEKGARSAA